MYYKGSIELLKRKNRLGIVGARSIGDYPDLVEKAKDFVASKLVNNTVIISGLALGSDTIAHQTTLDNNGKTISFIPSSLEEILPPSNQNLAREIVKAGGLLVSTYQNPINGRELYGALDYRNKLIVMYNHEIIVLAADKGSGTALTIKAAEEYGVPVSFFDTPMIRERFDFGS